jgi:hypothetical protein
MRPCLAYADRAISKGGRVLGYSNWVVHGVLLEDPPPSVGGANVTPSCALYLIWAPSKTPYTVYRALPK